MHWLSGKASRASISAFLKLTAEALSTTYPPHFWMIAVHTGSWASLIMSTIFPANKCFREIRGLVHVSLWCTCWLPTSWMLLAAAVSSSPSAHLGSGRKLSTAGRRMQPASTPSASMFISPSMALGSTSAISASQSMVTRGIPELKA